MRDYQDLTVWIPYRMEEFDFLVIGTGSGLDAANVAADRGQFVGVDDHH